MQCLHKRGVKYLPYARQILVFNSWPYLSVQQLAILQFAEKEEEMVEGRAAVCCERKCLGAVQTVCVCVCV
jgi:hypothetical protein